MPDFSSLASEIGSDFKNRLLSSSQVSYWAMDQLNINLYDNQIEIVEAVLDLNVKYLAILQARGAGKTFSVGLGLVKLCLDIPGIQIGVFGPKADQATRIISEITAHVIKPGSPIFPEVFWKKSTTARLQFFNGSQILALSADETAMQEGHHFNLVVLDECHRISDISVNQRIIPMLGSLPIGKIIKLGISMYRQNFWESCINSRYKLLSRDWTQCPILLTNGSVFYNDHEYPSYVIELMPLSMKERLFPDRPELHYGGALTEVDFKTQFGMEWVQDVDLALNGNDQTKLASGDHDILEAGRTSLKEVYFFGLDTAGGTILKGREDLDFTALSIWRKKSDNTKEKVKCFEWQGNIIDQIEDIRRIIHPQTGLFPCVFGLADYSNIAIGAVEAFKKEGIPIEGIIFSHTESTSHKNFKNAMFDQFIIELQSNRVKYPSLDKLNKDACMKKSFNEWCNIERHKRQGINDTIQAAAKNHDDHPCADVLAVWAIDKNSTFVEVGQKFTRLPFPVTGLPSVASRGVSIPQNPQQKNRYLK